jgi:hypothetical protein
MNNRAVILALFAMSLIASCELSPFVIGQAFAVADDFTHAVLDEDFTVAG